MESILLQRKSIWRCFLTINHSYRLFNHGIISPKNWSLMNLILLVNDWILISNPFVYTSLYRIPSTPEDLSSRFNTNTNYGVYFFRNLTSPHCILTIDFLPLPMPLISPRMSILFLMATPSVNHSLISATLLSHRLSFWSTSLSHFPLLFFQSSLFSSTHRSTQSLPSQIHHLTKTISSFSSLIISQLSSLTFSSSKLFSLFSSSVLWTHIANIVPLFSSQHSSELMISTWTLCRCLQHQI